MRKDRTPSRREGSRPQAGRDPQADPRKDTDGGYADIVFFQDLAAIERVIEAEKSSDVCATFFAIMDDDGSHRVYEVLKTYE